MDVNVFKTNFINFEYLGYGYGKRFPVSSLQNVNNLYSRRI